MNLLQSDIFTFRNQDYTVDQEQSFSGGVTSNWSAGNTVVCAQLYNPPSSGVTVLVDRVWFNVEQDGNVFLGRGTAAFFGSTANWQNKKLGSANGNARVQTEAFAAIPGTIIERFVIGALNGYDYEPIYPYMLEEGNSLIVTHNTTTLPLHVNFYGREI